MTHTPDTERGADHQEIDDPVVAERASATRSGLLKIIDSSGKVVVFLTKAGDTLSEHGNTISRHGANIVGNVGGIIGNLGRGAYDLFATGIREARGRPELSDDSHKKAA